MKKRLTFLLAALFVVSAASGFDVDIMDPVQLILLECRHVGGPTQSDDLLAYAKAAGLSDAEMSERLVELVELGLGDAPDFTERQLSLGALWGLAHFGGEKENDFVKEIMRTTNDETTRHIAVRVGIQMMPEKWEDWVREVVDNRSFDDLTRFDAYEEVFQIGQSGDEKTKQHVEKVLWSLVEQDEYPGNQERLRRWARALQDNE